MEIKTNASTHQLLLLDESICSFLSKNNCLGHIMVVLGNPAKEIKLDCRYIIIRDNRKKVEYDCRDM